MKKYIIIGIAFATLAAAPRVFALELWPVLAPSTWYLDTAYTCAPGTDSSGATDVYMFNPAGGVTISGADPTTVCDPGQYFDTGSFPTANDWLNNFDPGDYGTWHLVTIPVTSACNSGIMDYADCVATGDVISDQPIDMQNADTPPGPPAPVPLGGATSTIEQTQQNLGTAFAIFFACFFGMIWLLRKH